MAEEGHPKGTGALGGPVPEQVLPQKLSSPWRSHVRAQEQSRKEGAAQRTRCAPGSPRPGPGATCSSNRGPRAVRAKLSLGKRVERWV